MRNKRLTGLHLIEILMKRKMTGLLGLTKLKLNVHFVIFFGEKEFQEWKAFFTEALSHENLGSINERNRFSDQWSGEMGCLVHI